MTLRTHAAFLSLVCVQGGEVRTMKGFSLRFIEALVVGVEELEIFIRVLDLSDLIFAVEEVAGENCVSMSSNETSILSIILTRAF